jgi:hypothetical protein
MTQFPKQMPYSERGLNCRKLLPLVLVETSPRIRQWKRDGGE